MASSSLIAKTAVVSASIVKLTKMIDVASRVIT